MSLLNLSSGPGARIRDAKVIAVLALDHEEDAIPVAEALLKGGVRAMELTLRTPAAIESLRRIRQEVPDMLAGIGTILRAEQVDAVLKAGAEFGVSPGVNPNIIRYAKQKGLPFGPGIMSPTELDIALVQEHCHLLKFFPSESAGGLAHLKNIAAPYRHLDVQFIPLGGVNIKNLSTYLESDLVAAVGGSWLASPKLIQERAWDQIEQNAREATQVARQYSS